MRKENGGGCKVENWEGIRVVGGILERGFCWADALGACGAG